jgi:predicted ABC-type ATPase
MAELYGARRGRDVLFGSKAYAFDAYNPSEARASSGEWTAGGAGGGAAPAAKPAGAGGAPGKPGGGIERIAALPKAPRLSAEQRTKRGAEIVQSVSPEAAKAVADAEQRLKNGKRTIDLFKKNGVYTDERQAVHEKLLNGLFTDQAIAAATPKSGQKPVMTMLGGRGGSGKSWLTKGKNAPVDAAHAIVIDSDEFKRHLPEYEGWNAALLHDEVDDIVTDAVERAQHMGLNVVHDQTMKSAKSVVDRVDDYAAKGYDIHGHYMHLPADEAARRAVGRFMHGDEVDGRKTQTGRFVPAWVILGNEENEKNFTEMIPKFKRWSFYDNTHTKRGGDPDRVAGSE